MKKKVQLILFFMLINACLFSMDIEGNNWQSRPTYFFSEEKLNKFQLCITKALMAINYPEPTKKVVEIRDYLDDMQVVEHRLFQVQFQNLVDVICKSFLQDLEKSNSGLFARLRFKLESLFFEEDSVVTPLYFLNEYHLNKLIELAPNNKEEAAKFAESLAVFQKNNLPITWYGWRSRIKKFCRKNGITLPFEFALTQILDKEDKS